MKVSLKVVAAALSMSLAAPALAADAPVDAPSTSDAAAKQAESERQLLIAMFAVRDYCKEAQPDRAADIDKNWQKSTQDVPAALIEFSKTPNFAGLVAERIKSMHNASSNAEYGARIKASCDQMTK